MTKIDQTALADICFPEFDIDKWNEEVLSEHQYEKPSYKHLVYTRK